MPETVQTSDEDPELVQAKKVCQQTAFKGWRRGMM